MGLLQKAVETYEANQNRIGIYEVGKEPLAPVGHILTSADIEITLNADSKFLSARRVEKEEPKILIPVTEESGGRSGTKAYMHPHPLCDGLKYLIAEENYYIPQLEKWAESDFGHAFLPVVLTYLKGGSILRDLINAGLLKGNESGDKFEKLTVCWRIVGIDNEESACWKNRNLQNAFTQYYLHTIASRDASVCMIQGKWDVAAAQHPKGIIPINGNAKLISANDSTNFTYRGRFLEDWQAATVGYEATQKAHNALRWLASEQGVREFSGNRIFLCWNPQGKDLPQPMRRIRPSNAQPLRKPSDYQASLKNTLWGFRKDQQLKDTDTAILACFDAATTGRLAVTYYNEISMKLFLERIRVWDEHCCWYAGKYGIQAPNLLQIVECAFGVQRGAFLNVDDRIQRQHLQQLLNCKVSGGVFPQSIVNALVQRASRPLAYDENVWRRIMHTACSAIQKYRYDTRQGGNEMEWDLTKKDRSFQYGRLLAVMERAEADYYYRTQETRQTSAIKNMSEYRQRPFFVFERINRHLHQAYLNRIEPWQANRYERLVGEIFATLKEYPESELNKPLGDLYLMGYELQRNAFFEKEETRLNETEE